MTTIKVNLYKTTKYPFTLESCAEYAFGAKQVQSIGYYPPGKNAVVLEKHTTLDEPCRCFVTFDATISDTVKFLADAPQGCVTCNGIYGITIDLDKYKKLQRSKSEIAGLCGEEYVHQYDMPPSPTSLMNDC